MDKFRTKSGCLTFRKKILTLIFTLKIACWISYRSTLKLAVTAGVYPATAEIVGKSQKTCTTGMFEF